MRVLIPDSLCYTATTYYTFCDLTETIYVRVFEGRMDLLRAAIVGAPGTPYHDGLFFFDISLPLEYPHEPPVSFLTVFPCL